MLLDEGPLRSWTVPVVLATVGMIAAVVCGVAVVVAGGIDAVFPGPFSSGGSILQTREQYLATITWALVGRFASIVAGAAVLAAIVVAVVLDRRRTHIPS